MAQFPDTRWSLIQSAGTSGCAFEEWCNLYFQPVAAYVQALTGCREDTEEIVQEFFLRLMKRGNERAFANQVNGSFRAYLKCSVRNFVTDWRRFKLAKRRGGGQVLVNLEADDPGLVEGDAPDLLFDRAWVGRIMQLALERLESELATARRSEFFHAVAPLLDGRDADYKAIAGRFDMSAAAFRAALYRLRKRYRHLIEEELRQTVSSDEQFEEEKRHWQKIWQ